MENNFAIVTDSSCDLSGAMIRKLDLTIVPLSVNIEGKTTLNEPDWPELSCKDFYAALRGGTKATTSAPNIDQFVSAMTPLLESGRDVLVLSFSSGLSGTHNAGAAAAAEIREKFPERKIYVVDTLCASMGEGLMLYFAQEQRAAGRTIEQVRDYVEENKLHLCHWFTVDDLMFLKRGGRVGAATAVLGTILSIKPVMHVDDAGKLVGVSKVKGRRASLKALADKMRDTALQPFGERVAFISHGDCLEDAQYVEKLLRENAGASEVVIGDIGPVIGAHSGPGTVALFFLGTAR